MTNVISLFSRGLHQTNVPASEQLSEIEQVRRQAAIMPLRRQLTNVFLEVMNNCKTHEEINVVSQINEIGLNSLDEAIVNKAISLLTAMKGGFMPQFFRTA